MSARARATQAEAPPPGLAAALRTGEVSRTLPVGIGLAALGALSGVLAAVSGVVRDVGPAYPAWPLVALLALAPPVVAVVAAQRGSVDAAAGVLAGSGVVAAGRLLIDAQFLVDATVAARPELMAPPSSVLPLAPVGLGALLAADALAAAAGLLALRFVQSGGEGTRGEGRRQWRTVAGSGAAFVVVFGLLSQPYLSDDAYLADRSVLDLSSMALAGVLLLGAGMPFAAALAATAQSVRLGNAVLLGLALGAGGLVLPVLAAVLVVPWLHFAAGPVIALAGIAALVAVAVLPQRSATDQTSGVPAESDVRVEVRMPRLRWLHVATGALAMVTAGFAVAGSRLPFVRLPDGSAASLTPGQWSLLPAGGVLGALGVALLVPALARTVRPALSAAWSAVVVAGTAALALPLAASDLPVDVATGSGAVLTVIAVVVSVLVAGCSVVAGMVERETADVEPVGSWLRWPAGAASVLAVVAFAMPVVSSARYAGTALVGDVSISSAGLLVGLLVVAAACALAPSSRPERAAALLAGAAAVLVVRLLELPAITAAGDARATAAAGFWIGSAAVAALVATAGAAVLRNRR